jgi:hypothetical protein
VTHQSHQPLGRGTDVQWQPRHLIGNEVALRTPERKGALRVDHRAALAEDRAAARDDGLLQVARVLHGLPARDDCRRRR